MSGHAAFPDLPVLAELGDRLELAFAQAERAGVERPHRPRLGFALRPAVVALVLFVLLAAGAAAATLLALRGSVIPAPQKEDLQPPMTVRPETAHLSGVTARDPRNATEWTVRLARSQTGLVCVTAGELRDGRFGVTGLDGRFREMAPGFSDGCGAPGRGRAAIVGARVFDSGKRAQVRTVVDGYGGPKLRSVRIASAAGTHNAPVSGEGAFVAVYAGYPEDFALRLELRFDDGRLEMHRFGASSFITPDPDGALQIETTRISGFNHTLCVRVVSARQVKPFSRSAIACGDTHSDFFFRAQRLRTGEVHGNGMWGSEWHHSSRTVLFGHAHNARHLTVVGAGRARRVRLSRSGSFQLIYPASVNPERLALVVTKRDGSVERRSGQWALVPPPRLGRG
ncbi:MAG TPA: hypothetical protein VF066_02115 [Thermoleophilaceae bacterium]